MNRLPAALALLILLATPARAAVVGTAHDTELGGEGGACTACHIPHQAAGDKFWAQEPMYEGKVGTVAALCATCHHSGGGYGALMTRAHSDDFVYGANSHGQRMFLANPPAGTDVLASGLPNVDTAHGNFECTTCHSVHDDTYRPFLRDAPDALCARCHRLRHFVNGRERSGALVETGTWGGAVRMGHANPGSHPVGPDVAEGRPGGPALAIPPIFRLPLSPEPGRWSLGGHLTGGREGGVTCITCHAVHGSQPDPDDVAAAGPAVPPSRGFLVIAQAEASVAGAPRPVPNGAGSTSALCEGCHGVNNNPPASPTEAFWSDPAHNVSPGRPGSYSHPIDTYPAGTDTGVVAFPANWPEGSLALAGSNVAPVPICETCHAPHVAAALEAGRADVAAGAGAFLLRAPAAVAAGQTTFCDRCHTQAMTNHHPVGKTFDSTGVSYLQNVRSGPGDRLTCSTCHATAHNWSGPGWAGLDPAWLPRDNGRNAIQALDMYHPDMSKTCMDCHYFMDGDGASVSPTMGSAQTVIAATDFEYRYYEIFDRSMGTHYIGRIHEEATTWRNAPLIDVFSTTTTWRDQSPGTQYTGGLAPGWSRYGGEDRDGSRVLVCESCHELEPDRNAGFRHLLLAPYEEGRNGLDEYGGDSDGHDVLCEACHGIPTGSHPMTGNVVSKTGAALVTNAPWIRPQILGHATMDRERHAMSCDSCHQPHDTNPNSYTYCLDAPLHLAAPDWSGQAIERRGLESPAYTELRSSVATYLEANGQPGTYTTPRDGLGSFTGLCQQCHEK